MCAKYRQSGDIYSKGKDKYSDKDKEYKEGKASFKWHWSLTVLIIGILFGSAGTLFQKSYTFISYGELLLIAAIVGTIGSLLQFKYFNSRKFVSQHFRIGFPFFLAYNFIGIGFIAVALFLFVNRSFSPDYVYEEYEIIGLDRDYVIDAGGYVVLLLENDQFKDTPQFRAVPYSVAMGRKDYPYLEVQYYPGLFGYKTFEGMRLSIGKDGDILEIPSVKEAIEKVRPKETKPTIVQDSVAIDSLDIQDTIVTDKVDSIN